MEQVLDVLMEQDVNKAWMIFDCAGYYKAFWWTEDRLTVYAFYGESL